MRLPEFKVEQWMTEYENDAIYNLTDTTVKALTYKELMELGTIDDSMSLDYGAITGDVRLKEEILSLYTTGTIDQITTCQGCLQANEMVMNTLLDAGSHVITCVPGYQQFVDLPKSIGCEVSLIHCKEENDWIPSIDEFKDSIKDTTKMIILNNPNNPTGHHLDDAYMNELISLCKSKKIYILCDEVYKEWSDTYNHSISDLYEYGISTCSLSKYFGLSGLRFGWVKANLDVISQINTRRDYSIISTGPLIDTLAYNALKNKELLMNRSDTLIQKNKAMVKKWLIENPHYHCVIPEYGTVGFLRYDYRLASNQYALSLLKEKGIFFVPGACFDYDGYFRIGFAQDAERMEKGLELLSKYFD